MIGSGLGYPIGFLNRGANRVTYRVGTNPPSRPEPYPNRIPYVGHSSSRSLLIPNSLPRATAMQSADDGGGWR